MHVERLSKTYGSFTALQDVTFRVPAGEVSALIGPNGAGKTTLFECVAGVSPADAGTVTIDGTVVTAAERGRYLFYLPDGIAPWPAQSIAWIIDFVIGYFGGRGQTRDDVVRRLELTPLLSQRLGTLSKGQRKRVLLGVALLTPQPLLLVDEPFDGLDLRQTRDISLALREHAASGRTIFLSIHQIVDAVRVCDRFVLLSGGRICGDGVAADLSEELVLART